VVALSNAEVSNEWGEDVVEAFGGEENRDDEEDLDANDTGIECCQLRRECVECCEEGWGWVQFSVRMSTFMQNQAAWGSDR
jgi:hypothetical protein